LNTNKIKAREIYLQDHVGSEIIGEESHVSTDIISFKFSRNQDNNDYYLDTYTAGQSRFRSQRGSGRTNSIIRGLQYSCQMVPHGDHEPRISTLIGPEVDISILS